jgi:Protein of unknown function (DUF4235)
MKIAFTPFSIVLGLIAGMIGKKIFEGIWGLVDDEEPPDAKHRDISYTKLVLALVFEGAIFRLVKGLTDHGARQAFARTMGTWPGEEEPEPE